MRRARHSTRAILAAAALTLMLAGCSNPDAGGPPGGAPSVQSAGEPAAPPPYEGAPPADVQASPQAALNLYAHLYINWTSATLSGDQARLAAISTGQARLTDLQAAAETRRDGTLARAHITNTGTVISIAPDRTAAGMWVIVTRQQTSGSGEYEGLPAAYHVTLAGLTRLPHGWAVKAWLAEH